MSILNPTETHWCERMQDMSGYVLPDSILPPLDEQLNFTFSTTHHENDFEIQNPENTSPGGVILEDQADAGFLEEDSDMFDSSNYSLLDTELKTWLPSLSETEEFVKTTADDKFRDFPPPSDSKNSSLCVGAKEVKKLSSTTKKPSYLSIFEFEEPHIKEDPDTLSDCCTDSKLIFRDEMEVAAEEVVITEDEENPNVFLCNTKTSLDLNTLWRSAEMKPVVPKAEVVEDKISSPPSSFPVTEDCEGSLDCYSADPLVWMADYETLPTSPNQRSMLPLRLNIEAARMSANQLFGDALPDTPEVLRPVLKPETDFDLVSFLLATGDSNNNAVIPSYPSKKPSTTRLDEPRRGKSLLSLKDLKASQTLRKSSLPETVVEDEHQSTSAPSADSFCDRLSLGTVPTPTPLLTLSGRPRRESATRLNKRLEQAGYLTSIQDSNAVSSDDESTNYTTKSKRRRTTSSSNRSRLNSDSDQSVVCDSLKYRERRDRNNVSSKKSRQKRKEALEMKTFELRDLEQENKRLKEKADELAKVLNMVHKAWKDYLSSLKKEEEN